MTKKFDESLENTDWVVVASPTLKRQRASNQAVQDGQQCIFDATSPTAPNSQHQESQERAVLDHWQPILSNVIILAFLGTSIFLSIKCDYLFFEEISKGYFIISLLLIFKYSGGKGHDVPNFRDDFRQQD